MRAPRKNPELNDAIELLDYYYINANSIAADAWSQLSADELAWIDTETEKCIDLRYYLENYHFITTEDGVLKALHPFWDHQEIVYEAMQEEWAENGYCKLIILKPRQTGISTWIQAAMFHRTIFTPHCFTMLMAQNDTTAAHIYNMSLKAYFELPWWLRPEYMYKTKKGAIEFQRADEKERFLDPGLGSVLQVANAAQMSGVAIGRTIRNLHMSEVSRYPNDEVYEGDIKPSMRARDTFAVMESTGYGRQGLFYEQWSAAVDGDTDFRAVFIPVYKVRKYYLPIKGAFELAPDEEAFNVRIKTEEDFEIPDEFWNFRRRGLRAARRGGNKAGFLESYPLTPMEAFQNSGLCAFDRDSLEWQELNFRCKPKWAGEITLVDIERNAINTDAIHEVKPHDILPKRKSGRGGDRFHIWEWPERDETYYVAMDVALGNGGDYSVACVWRAGRGMDPDALVATWWGWIPPRRFAHVGAAIGIFYNHAEIACEYEKDGITTGNELRDLDYPNLYRPQAKDRLTNQAMNYLHWLTNSKTRDEIIGCMNEALLDHTVIIRDEDLLDEMLDFASLDTGGRMEGQGNNDDGVMSEMIGLYCCRETTKHLKTTASTEHTRETGEIHIWGVYDNLMRQRGQHKSKAVAEKMIEGKPGWSVRAVLICQANTIYSPIFDGAGAENELRFRHGVQASDITPDMVYAYRSAMNKGIPQLDSGEEFDPW